MKFPIEATYAIQKIVPQFPKPTEGAISVQAVHMCIPSFFLHSTDLNLFRKLNAVI